MVNEHNTEFFRIIGGKFRGKKLNLPPTIGTRSSKSILRESFFNTLQNGVIDKIFIEAFAGSGSVGIEAISRGAKEAIFFELEPTALKVLKRNLKELKVDNYKVFGGDVFLMLPPFISSLTNGKNEIICYIDPPFNIRENQEYIYQKCIKLIEQLPKESIFLIVIEHITKEIQPQTIGEFEKFKTKKFGKSSLSYYIHKGV